MRKIKLYIAQSLDGFIATKDGGVEWLEEPGNSELDINTYGYLDLYNSIDTTLMGFNTYKFIVDSGVPFPYPDKKNYVFSRNHTNIENNPVEFVSSDIVEFVSNLKNKEGADIWLVGGGEINKQLLAADLIDEVILFIKPVLLGDGLPLFAKGTPFTKFKVDKVDAFDNTLIQLIMTRK